MTIEEIMEKASAGGMDADTQAWLYNCLKSLLMEAERQMPTMALRIDGIETHSSYNDGKRDMVYDCKQVLRNMRGAINKQE